MTDVGDLVLVTIEGNPAFFARVEAITPDVKPGWHHVKMLVLQIPLMTISWILRMAYINGEEFTMGGRPVRLTRVVAPEEEAPAFPEEEEPKEAPKAGGDGSGEEPAPEPESSGKGKVVSLFDRKKKDHPS